MSSLTELMGSIQKYNLKYGHEKEWEILRDRIMTSNDTKEYWFTLLKDVENFLKSSAPKSEKEKLRGYTERLAVMIDAFDSKYFDE